MIIRQAARLSWALIAATLLCSAVATGAHSQSRLELSPDGKCPAADAIPKAPVRTIGDLNTVVQVQAPKAALYRQAELGNTISGEPLGFGTRVVKLYSEGRVSLVRLAIGDRCGWLLTEQLRTVNEPLLLSRIPGYETRRDPDGRPPRLVAKVLLKGVSQDGGKLQPVPLYDSPTKQARKIGDVGYFTILEVHDVKSESGGPCTSIDSDDCYLLVGGTESQGGNSVSVASLKGWIRATHAELWPTALSLFFAPGREEVRIYETEKAARDRDDKQIKFQNRGSYKEPVDRNIARFPVLDTKLLVARPGAEDQYIYHILLPGEPCTAGGALCLTQVGTTLKELDSIDVLFVIDATESMKRYYSPVVQAVSAVATKDARERQKAMRFAAAVYGDYLFTPNVTRGTLDNSQYKPVADFAGLNDGSALAGLNRVPLFVDEQKDQPEASFAALIKAVKEAKWRQGSVFRMVVWIGDQGNRPPGVTQESGAAGPVDETVTSDMVASAFKEAGADLFALHVKGDGGTSHYKAFEDQVKEIVTKLGQKPENALIRVDEGQAGFDEQKVKADVLRQLTGLLERSSAAGDIITAALTTGNRSDSDLPAVQFSEVWLRKRGYTQERLRELRNQILAVEDGWVYQDDARGNADFAYWLGLQPKNFGRLTSTMNVLCDNLQSTDFQDEYVEALRAALEAVTGDRPKEGETVSGYYERRLSIPKRKFSAFLDKEPRDWVREAMLKPELRNDLCKKSYLLRSARDKKRVAPEDLELVGGKWNAKKGKETPFDWAWNRESGVTYYFIPLEFLP